MKHNVKPPHMHWLYIYYFNYLSALTLVVQIKFLKSSCSEAPITILCPSKGGWGETKQNTQRCPKISQGYSHQWNVTGC